MIHYRESMVPSRTAIRWPPYTCRSYAPRFHHLTCSEGLVICRSHQNYLPRISAATMQVNETPAKKPSKIADVKSTFRRAFVCSHPMCSKEYCANQSPALPLYSQCCWLDSETQALPLSPRLWVE